MNTCYYLPNNHKLWSATATHPYPMNFVQAPSASNQILVTYNGKPQLQGLSANHGPVMFPLREITSCPTNSYERKHTIYTTPYPTTHSIPGPYLQSYIALPNRMYPY